MSNLMDNMDEYIKQIGRSQAGYRKALKQSGGQGGYKSNLLAGELKMKDQIAKAYESKGNIDAQNKMKAEDKMIEVFEELALECIIFDVIWSMIGCTKEEMLSALVGVCGDYFELKNKQK